MENNDKRVCQEVGKGTPTIVWFWWHHLLDESFGLKKKASSLPLHIYKVETIYKTIQLAEMKVMSIPKRLCCYHCFIVFLCCCDTKNYDHQGRWPNQDERPQLARMKQQPAVKAWVMKRHILFIWRLLAVW